jgi:hypothetical protein
MQKSKHRGHAIEFTNSIWIYCDTKKPVSESIERCCGVCNCPQTDKGHDPCIGTLKHVMNACCGHGERQEAYVQFSSRLSLSGFLAVIFITIFKRRTKWKKLW